MGLVAAVAVGASWVAVALTPGDSHSAAVGPVTICVTDLAGTDATNKAVARAKALEPELHRSLLASIERERARGSKFDGTAESPQVTGPCPGESRTPSDEEVRLGRSLNPPTTSAPSGANIRLVVVPESAAQGFMRDAAFLRMAYHMQCQTGQDVCAEVSTVVFVRSSRAGDPAILQEAVETAAGWNHDLRYPNGHPASEDRAFPAK